MTTTLQTDDSLFPRLGLGLFGIPPGFCSERAVAWALKVGYRHIDTAPGYRNESNVAVAVRNSGLPLDEIFLATKVPPVAIRPAQVRASLEQSLRLLGVECVDLCLLHRPVPHHIELWEELLKLKQAGFCRFAGISNVNCNHLVDIERNGLPVPDAIQIEIHPFLPQSELRRWCFGRQIKVIGYSPLARGARLDHPIVVNVAKQIARTPAQVLLRWSLDKCNSVVVGSMDQLHIADNFRALEFELPLECRNPLDLIQEHLRVSWDPAELEFQP
jgi:diketogulonate reductase-like aldo/keto reductase